MGSVLTQFSANVAGRYTATESWCSVCYGAKQVCGSCDEEKIVVHVQFFFNLDTNNSDSIEQNRVIHLCKEKCYDRWASMSVPDQVKMCEEVLERAEKRRQAETAQANTENGYQGAMS